MNIIFILLIFGLIIIIHELGHFLLAKKNGITVTEFSVGMGPRLASFVRKGTRYSIKILPFGGSCMMLGEDESVEDEGAFHKKGVWARISVILAGPVFNFILAYILSLIVIGSVGVDPARVIEVTEDSPAAEAGLQEGDMITKINGSTIHLAREIDSYFLYEPLSEKPVNITYKRDGEKFSTKIIPASTDAYMLGFTYNSQNGEVLQVIKESPFDLAGITPGDILVAINQTPVEGTGFSDYIQENPLTGEPVTITVKRNDTDHTVEVTPRLYTNYDMGWTYNQFYEKVSAPKVIVNSVYEVKFWIVNTMKGLVHMVRGNVGMDEIAGPVGIVNVMNDVYEESREFGLRAILLSLSSFSILLSANLGVMNLLPIPALDGGRLVFLFIEAIRGKPINREKEAMVHFIGIAALMLLMVFVLFNDIRNILT